MISPGADRVAGPASDADRLLRTLWEVDEPGSRGPRASITRDAIVTAAVDVADADGLEALSMRAVADRLGAGVMSLYRHIEGKSDLLAFMVDRVTGEIRTDVDHRDWRSAMTHLAHEHWALLHRHPWLLQVPLGRTSPGPRTMRVLDAGMQAALSTGLGPSGALGAYVAVDSLVLGAARTSMENLAARRATGLSEVEWWEQQGPALAELVDAERFPAVTLLVEAGAFATGAESEGSEDPDGHLATFEASLGVLLDGIEAQIAAQIPTTP